jgi:hypothetical protein
MAGEERESVRRLLVRRALLLCEVGGAGREVTAANLQLVS